MRNDVLFMNDELGRKHFGSVMDHILTFACKDWLHEKSPVRTLISRPWFEPGTSCIFGYSYQFRYSVLQLKANHWATHVACKQRSVAIPVQNILLEWAGSVPEDAHDIPSLRGDSRPVGSSLTFPSPDINSCGNVTSIAHSHYTLRGPTASVWLLVCRYCTAL